ncbi:23090_t:CDS:2 [Gigaspora margarita]|uniref:23090_t:CDS:1 n=1 Tax=Gigaspora margarita TaxID=4874 RepID=A0ABM8VVL8_GIGMA|nr:23090_t:CDS:2 [Gigaspora margarita]
MQFDIDNAFITDLGLSNGKQDKQKLKSTDIYDFGIIMTEILNNDDLSQNDYLVDLINHCKDSDQNNRPLVTTIVAEIMHWLELFLIIDLDEDSNEYVSKVFEWINDNNIEKLYPTGPTEENCLGIDFLRFI